VNLRPAVPAVLSFTYPRLTGKTITVAAGQSLQQALNQAARGDEILRKGRCAYRKHLDIWHECSVTGKWPGYDVICRPLTEPRWAQEEA
jgi:hypothetical protein